MRRKKFFALVMALMTALPSFACTSVIISASASASGRPVMFKHRDTGEHNNRIERFEGPSYSFVGLVNSPSEGGEVWAGTNSAGFSIMNTASYNLKDDKVPESKMDREGSVMYLALGKCASLKEFEKMLDSMSRPMGVETNFGVIDAEGGAAYYEVNNSRWVKFDVNEEPCGYRVVTNFSFSGRPEDAQGVERYETASAIMSELYDASAVDAMGHKEFVNLLSRSYRHERMGLDLARDLPAGGIFVDQDFIPRRITSASVVMEGVAAGENPLHCVMWTLIGHPACSVMVPVLVGEKDLVPAFLKRGKSSDNCSICDDALRLKNKYVFDIKKGNGKHYFHADVILKGTCGRPSLLQCARETETYIDSAFGFIFGQWCRGELGDAEFYEKYAFISSSFYEVYKSKFVSYLNFD